jgi:hypothetical protein
MISLLITFVCLVQIGLYLAVDFKNIKYVNYTCLTCNDDISLVKLADSIRQRSERLLRSESCNTVDAKPTFL